MQFYTAVIIMQLIKLNNHIISSFDYTFRPGETFMWSPDKSTIFYRSVEQMEDIWSLLHEIAHAELKHATFGLDIELVKHEAQAWKYATTVLAPRFNLVIDDEYVQGHLDTYREWMFARSVCPSCGHTGLQTQNTYSCINCRCSWRANEARLCALRRTRLPIQSQIVS